METNDDPRRTNTINPNEDRCESAPLIFQQQNCHSTPGPIASRFSFENITSTNHKKTNSISSLSTSMNHHVSFQSNQAQMSQHVHRASPLAHHHHHHHRTRSVDLRLNSASTLLPSLKSCSSSSSLSSSGSVDHSHHHQSTAGNDRNPSSLLANIEEKVSKLYYKHGLFCSRHPLFIIFISLLIVSITSYQIVTFRGIFGSSYDIYISSRSGSSSAHHFVDNHHYHQSSSSSPSDLPHPLMKHFDFWPDSYVRNELDDDQNVPPWFQSNQSYAYVQQIYIRSAVIPWTDDMLLVDALRGPFDLIFELIESVSNFQFKNDFGETITLSDVCFQVFEPTLSKRYSHITSHLPAYSCLVLSPANIWHGDHTRFQQDTNLLTTLLKFQDVPTSPVPSGAMHDILFGVTFEETGIRRTYGQNRVRTISYSITLILRRNVPEFLQAMKDFLQKRYPLSTFNKNLNKGHPNKNNGNGNDSQDPNGEDDIIDRSFVNTESQKTKHIYFHNTFTYNYLLPLTLIYAIVCFYMYFSVRKMEIIRNKRLYSVCTLITALMSLFMSFGICFRLRFHSVLIVNRLLPYFVAGISFENMLVLTKSVLANPHLDSKVRVAQGLSKEGLSITKNLIAELTLLSIGSFTFIPFFQECCKIAAVCFLSDFFIQITFFTSFFSLLIQRINVCDRNKYSFRDGINPKPAYPRNIYARPGEPVQQKTPKRLRFIYFLARLRLVQRCVILMLSACIGLAIYNAYVVLEQQNTTYDQTSTDQNFPTTPSMFTANQQNKTSIKKSSNDGTLLSTTTVLSFDKFDSSRQESFMKLLETSTQPSMTYDSSDQQQNVDQTKTMVDNPYHRILYYRNNPMPRTFANHHWTNLFSLYNISLVGRFISILPPMLLSIPISPERAKQLRITADSDYQQLKKFIPMKFTNGEYVVTDDDDYDKFKQFKRDHWSRQDIQIIIGLWVPSLIFFIYLVVQLYRCMCTRNYAEWRSQLTNPLTRFSSFLKRTALESLTSGSDSNGQGKLFRIDISLLNYDREKEVYLNEKQYRVDNLDLDLICTNLKTSLVATSSLSGDLRVYDALTYESLATVKRSQTNNGDFFVYKRSKILGVDDDENILPSHSTANVVKTDGNILRTLFYGINTDNQQGISGSSSSSNLDKDNCSDQKMLDFRPIWCMDIYDRYILIGCGGDDGRFEVYNAYTGQLTFVHESDYQKEFFDDVRDSSKINSPSFAITTLKATYWGVALARLSGQVEMLEIVEQCREEHYSHRMMSGKSGNSELKLKYRFKWRWQAHQQPITRMEIIDSLEDEEFIRVFGSRGCLITGSQDTTLKVFALDNFKLMYTLNGHCGAIITTCIDPHATASALSGCQLGQLCVWDLNTGTCIFSMQAHNDAEVLSITTSPLYYVSTGSDNTICIWDRFSGHLIHTITNQHTICRNMLFLEPYILVTVRDGELVIWDVNDARTICLVPLANHCQMMIDNAEDDVNEPQNRWTKSYQNASIKNLMFSYQRKALICDYGNSLCIINNPFAVKKMD